MNLQQDSAEPYAACPYCLTKITEAQLEAENKPEKATEPQLEAENKPEKAQIETGLPEEKPTKNREKPLTCHHYLGYLSERAQKEQIPDECIVCKDIVECMLRKMRT
ncbi:MAG: hypothetical protein ABSA75_01420 [Candidatus Bathyarchaeia archaeon]